MISSARDRFECSRSRRHESDLVALPRAIDEETLLGKECDLIETEYCKELHDSPTAFQPVAWHTCRSADGVHWRHNSIICCCRAREQSHEQTPPQTGVLNLCHLEPFTITRRLRAALRSSPTWQWQFLFHMAEAVFQQTALVINVVGLNSCPCSAQYIAQPSTHR